MSAVSRKPRTLERFRAKVKTKKTAERQGAGKKLARYAKTVNLKNAAALKKVSGKKVQELEKLSVADLQNKVVEARKELFNLRFKQATGQLENVALIPATKRLIARVLTLIKQKEVGA